MQGRQRFSVVLASASPRRRQLLRKLFQDFEVLSPDVDENNLTCEHPVHTAERLARAKAEAIASIRREAIVIAGDTVVYLDLETGPTQLAKPVDSVDACRMLSLLSGRTHQVTTGLCVCFGGWVEVCHDTTNVTFRKLSADEIEAYVATGEPMDKAGAYGIQAGATPFVQQVQGSLTNVIGLPMEKLQEVLDLEPFASALSCVQGVSV